MKPAKVHIIYEYGLDTRPHASSHIRLLRPLTHPSIANQLEVTFSPRHPTTSMDVVIVDRLWRPDITPSLAEQLVDKIHSAGARFIYALDDNLLDLAEEKGDWPESHHIQALDIFLQEADMIWVPSYELKQRLLKTNHSIEIIANALDERLLCFGCHSFEGNFFKNKIIKIGYMGTRSHDQDLLMIVPAFRKLWQHHPDKFDIEIIGVTSDKETLETLSGLPVIIRNPPLEEQEYPLFQIWFTSCVKWDIAIAPLHFSPFARCKSDIKFLDYSSIGAAGIFSHTPAYASTVQHLENGMLVENQVDTWLNALDELLQNEKLRTSFAQNASRYLFNERILAQCAHKWAIAIEKSI